MRRLLAACLLVMLTAPAVAQTPIRLSPTPPAKSSNPPRTPWGAPDLQGNWTTETFTPLQRPPSLAGKEFFTPEEAADLNRLLTSGGVDPLARIPLGSVDEIEKQLQQSPGDVHYDNAIWLAGTRPKGLSTLRTSLIVDPPDGRIPPLTPEARARIAALGAAAKEKAFDGPESRPLTERCIIWPHEGPPLLPPPYNNMYQIVQSPDYVVVVQEIIHDARIIPLKEGPHLPPTIRQWSGDSRGHWEGDTLVVDTTNFTALTRFQGSTDALHVVERFTRVDADTILYRFTVDDPNTWTRPWTAEIPMMRTNDQLYEYACHEGNYDLANILRSARARDAVKGSDKRN